MWSAAEKVTERGARPEATPGAAEAPAHGAGRRPALDGLRALAVTSVAVYHFGGGDSSWLPGGFLGVDVFFVLSGYLITSLLLTEYARTGRISLAGFWTRRVKRLAPAMILMLLVVAAWVWWTAAPTDYPARRADILWTLGYLANWHLAVLDNYFAQFGAVSPLRHTWSLAIEEQFYLVWPLIALATLWLGTRLGRRWRAVSGPRLLAVVALGGALISVVLLARMYTPVHAAVAYYSTRGRVQELFAGALLALAFARLHRAGREGERTTSLAVGAAGTGLLGLGGAVLAMPDTAAFYYRGGATLVSLAAVAVIAGVELRPQSRLAAGLGWAPAAWLGRVSYGVYLWHWPVCVAIPAQGPFWAQAGWQLVRVALSLALATASFYLLERPVQRSRRWLATPARTAIALGTAAALVVVSAVQATSLPGTIYEQAATNTDRACPAERTGYLQYCLWPAGATATDGPPALAILGDSTIRGLSRSLDTWATSAGTTWVEAAWRQCSSVGALTLKVPNETMVGVNACHQQAPVLIRQMLAEYHPKVVLIGDFWVHQTPIRVGDHWAQPGTAEHDAALRELYLDLVDDIADAGSRAVFVELAPPSDQLGAQFAKGRPAASAKPPAYHGGKYVAGFNAVLRDVAAQRPDAASTISITDVVCPGGSCPAAVGDTLIRVDGVHYSERFAAQLTPVVLQRAGVTP